MLPHWKRVSGFLGSICLLASLCTAAEPAVQRFTTPDGVEYGTWGTSTTSPAPTLFILASDIESTLSKSYYRQCGNELAAQGWLCVSVDLPCHGKETRGEESPGLSGWSVRAQQQQDFVAENNTRLSLVLDHLIQSGLTDPQRIAICGTSRGGFLAIHFAAHESRVACAAGFAPVTDLAALSEFRSLKDNSFVAQLSLTAVAEKLAGRPVWMVIGDQDERVGTDRAYAFAQRVTAVSREQNLPSKIELNILPEPRGHTTPAGSPQRAAAWILQQLSEPLQPDSTDQQPAVRLRDSRDILFVDDNDVLYRAGTQRVFHPAQVNPSNPVVQEDRPWEMAIGWTSIWRHPETGKYQLWYQAYAGERDPRKTHECTVCYAESDDGVTFTKPSLELHDFQTSRPPYAGNYSQTNIVLLGDGGYGDRYGAAVLFDPDDQEPGQRYKMLYTDFSKDASGQEWPGLQAAFSTDGIHWTKSTLNPLSTTAYGGRGLQPPFSGEEVYTEVFDRAKNFTRKTWIIPLSMSDAVDVMFDPLQKKYVAYGKCWLQGPAGTLAWKHAMARIESEDFLHWSKPVIVASPDDLDPPNNEFHTSPVFFYKGVYFCLNQILSARGEATGAKADAMHIELMISRDGFHWERPFRNEKFIDNLSQPFSNGGIFTNATPVILEDQIRFYYGGYNSGAIGGGAKLTDPAQQSGVGFASLPLDRFAGLRPVPVSAQSTLKRPLENIGQITLKPIELNGVKGIFLNADASQGSIAVEILNEEGFRTPGFSRDEAIPLVEDSLRQSLRWKDRATADLPAGKYMIRLHLNNAEVFALTLAPTEN